MAELQFDDAAAAGYNSLTGPVSRHFIPFLLRAARIGAGMRVLDVATGTGLAAEAALAAVGLSGSVVAADISRAVERARERLGGAPNAIVAVEDGQSLTFADESFDAVLCSLGLMFFPDPARGLSEFHRVLRPGGRAAVSVNTVPERSLRAKDVSLVAEALEFGDGHRADSVAPQHVLDRIPHRQVTLLLHVHVRQAKAGPQVG